ncbi:electron transport complex subunit E [Alkalilimnicola ehrlichii MLHE-1]|uniref:Ion-translocating oxidoreductase complex subunit E n=1 Tax=Alkalilimnicola ehrlichii (strain ATCC BAA-1101 / DSM 17681 / MLHE-1) TaxID=187272 RepID=Q0AAH2_ALKEH|nr:electron transport complex subunit E [Alkalilimnicola ehrlichii]ABI56165.1 electron transport complex, RnfABCDGE type, E subunit [Alkalilimnicola ehrlichii MLHE-1]
MTTDTLPTTETPGRAPSAFQEIARKGLWENNPALVQLLGLCPLLAVTGTVVNAAGLALATLLVLVASNLTVSLIRNQVRTEVRIPVFVLVIASFVTAVELIMEAWFHQLYLVLGIFIPLIVTNCAILGRAEAFAARNPPGRAALDGLMMGVGFGAVLLLLGAMREALGQGTLLSNAHLLLGEAGRGLEITLIPDYPGYLIALLPPGAFIGLGLILAGKNWLEQRRSGA